MEQVYTGKPLLYAADVGVGVVVSAVLVTGCGFPGVVVELCGI